MTRREICRLEIDHCRVMHDLGIVLSRKDVTGAAHVSCKLIDLIDPFIKHGFPALAKAQIGNHKIIRFRWAVFRVLKVSSAHPIALGS